MRFGRVLSASAVCLFASLVIALPAINPIEAEAAGSRTVTVGLAYSSGGTDTRLSEMSLYSSSGFSLGTSSQGQFIRTTSISDTEITLLADGNGGINIYNASDVLIHSQNSDARFALSSASGGTVRLPAKYGKLENNSFYGWFEFFSAGRYISCYNHIDLEQYVKGVMGCEIGTNASYAVTQAFSVLVRTVPLTSKHSSSGFDVCAQTCCQLYKGTKGQSSENDKIVDSTRGKIVTYNGQAIDCLYHYSNGGSTCSAEAAWGHSDTPYLSSVEVYEPEESIPTWEFTFTGEELFSYLVRRPSFSSLKGGIESVSIVERDPDGSNYVSAFSVTDIYGNEVIVYNANQVRSSLAFNTANFTVRYVYSGSVETSLGTEETSITTVLTAEGLKEITAESSSINVITADEKETLTADTYVFEGKGQGHGVGFSQLGAEYLVSQGSSYTEAVLYFFPGTKITNLY